MTTYNTGNPIGSTAVKDLYDNAENLDTAVNDTSRDTWSDRLGRSRKTMSGMEREFNADQASRDNRFNTFIASSGYQFLGDYASGIEITEYNQIVRDLDGEFWRLSGQVELPYTTTGSGLPEDGSLAPLGDAVLRQQLSDKAQGAAMIGRGVVAVDSIADLLSLPAGQRKEGLQFSVASFYEGKNQGGGIFVWDAGKDKAEADGGMVIDPNNIGTLKEFPDQAGLDFFIENQGEGEGSGCFVRVGGESITGECWGIADDLEVSGALNKMFLATRGFKQKISTHSNNIRITSEVTCYGTGAEFTGTVRFKSYAGSFRILDASGSRTSYQIDLSKVTDIPEMTHKIDFLSEVTVGHYVLINTSEKVNRYAPGQWLQYDKTLPVKIVGEDGLVSCRFPWSVERENITDVTVFEPVPNVSILFSDIVVENDEDQPAVPYYHLIAVRRDSVTLEIKSISSTHPSNRVTGTVTTSGNNVTIQNSKLLSLGASGDLYAVQFSSCVDLRVLGCNDVGNGSAVAGRHGSNTRISGCDFTGRIDDHAGSDMVVSQTKCDHVSFAGADILLKDVVANSYHLLAVRGDTPILRGNVVIEGGAVTNIIDSTASTRILSCSIPATMSGFGYPPSIGDYIKISGVIFSDRETFNNALADCTFLSGSSVPSYVSEGGYVLKPRVVDISNIRGASTLNLRVGFASASLFNNDPRPPIVMYVSQCTARTLLVNGVDLAAGTPDREAWQNTSRANGTVVVRAAGCEIDNLSIDHAAIKSCYLSDSFIKSEVGSLYGSTRTGKQGRGVVSFSNCTFGEGVNVNGRVDEMELLSCRIKDYTNFKPRESKVIRSIGTVVDVTSPETPSIDLLQHVDGSVYQV